MNRFNLRKIDFADVGEAKHFLKKYIGCEAYGSSHMGKKIGNLNILAENLKDPACHIVKQAMLSLGGEAAVHHDTIIGKGGGTSVLLMGTEMQMKALAKGLKLQDFGMKELSAELTDLLSAPHLRSEREIPYRDGTLVFGKKTLIMGILNCTPDSFSDGGKWFDEDKAVAHALEMEKDGADVIDIGGESTRPGSAVVSAQEEMDRVLPVIRKLQGKLKVPISIDSYKPVTVKAALDEGAQIINDIWGFQYDGEMAKIAAEYQCPTIIMHNKKEAVYDNFLSEMLAFLRKSIAIGLDAGCKKEQLIVDPGFGFGKEMEHNLLCTKYLQEMEVLGCPILMAASRKKTLGLILDEDAEHRIEGDAAITAMSIAKGADMVRVHDVKEMAKVAKVADAVMRVGY